MTTTTKAKPMKPHQIAALRALEEYPHNPIREGHVEAGTLAALRRRGLVGREVTGRGKGQRTTSPITAAGCAVLDAVDGPSWSVCMANHLHTPSDPDDEPAFFHREFRARSAVEAHAAAVAWAADAGDCSPSGGVEDVDGPAWAATVGEGVAK